MTWIYIVNNSDRFQASLTYNHNIHSILFVNINSKIMWRLIKLVLSPCSFILLCKAYIFLSISISYHYNILWLISTVLVIAVILIIFTCSLKYFWTKSSPSQKKTHPFYFQMTKYSYSIFHNSTVETYQLPLILTIA